ncbi:hypothetical protein NHX12_012557 [Muraenolepis orangiensis]|uniref:Periphilin-1 C-terminal domain-containing protein n=1 Tax=Muraenolepis orangiensis TaxID=630683 RepID=A0A9Q0DED4_9TELE|nr:hypothetical protein NHX12_012557 [Muraenolepis orangiensis]
MTPPVKLPSPTGTDRSGMPRAHKSDSSADSCKLIRRNARFFLKPSFRRSPTFIAKCLPSRQDQRSVAKTQISHAEWRKIKEKKEEEERKKNEKLESHAVTERRRGRRSHRASSPPVDKPGSSGSSTSRTLPSSERDKHLRKDGYHANIKIKDEWREMEEPSPVGQALARSSAIQQKRKEIEELPQGGNHANSKTEDEWREMEEPSPVGQALARSSAIQQKRNEIEELPQGGNHVNIKTEDEWSEMEEPSPVSQALARSSAIQQKRNEIEEVYRRDCGIFFMVVQKLVSKEPSLEPPIQFSLQENLREIALRCAAAMDQFITQYDQRNDSQ